MKTGDIVIFPGWCEHQALPNEDDAPRIILGTNYFVTGTFGGVVPVHEVDDHELTVLPDGSLVKDLQSHYTELVDQESLS